MPDTLTHDPTADSVASVVEALCHMIDGVLRVYVELVDSRHTSSVHHLHPQQFIGAMSHLLAGLTNADGPCGNAGNCGTAKCALAYWWCIFHS